MGTGQIEVVTWGVTRTDRVLSSIRAEVKAAVGRWAQAHCAEADAFLAEAGDVGAALVFSCGYLRRAEQIGAFTRSPAAALAMLSEAPSGVVVQLVDVHRLTAQLERWGAVIEQIPPLATLLSDFADKGALRAL